MAGGFVSVEITNEDGVIIYAGNNAIVKFNIEYNLLHEYMLTCTAAQGSKKISKTQIAVLIVALQAMHDKMSD